MHLLVVYDDSMGMIPGSNFHKYCTNQPCGLTTTILLEGYPHRLFAIRVGKLSILCVIW